MSASQPYEKEALIRFLQVVDQDPEKWEPYVNREKLLSKIAESYGVEK